MRLGRFCYYRSLGRGRTKPVLPQLHSTLPGLYHLFIPTSLSVGGHCADGRPRSPFLVPLPSIPFCSSAVVSVLRCRARHPVIINMSHSLMLALPLFRLSLSYVVHSARSRDSCISRSSRPPSYYSPLARMLRSVTFYSRVFSFAITPVYTCTVIQSRTMHIPSAPFLCWRCSCDPV